MSPPSGQQMEERILIEKCLAGEAEALTRFRENYLDPLRAILVRRGANPAAAEEIAANLWTDCVVGRAGQPALLEKYTGRSSLKNWVFRVGLNRFFDSQRRHPEVSYLQVAHSPAASEDQLADAPVLAPPPVESGLNALLHASLKTAFDLCPAEDLLKLRLFYLHNVTQRELAQIWNCHEATIARDVDRALHQIADWTLREIGLRDPKLKLTWEDFLILCETEELEFL